MPRGDKPTTVALALKDGWVYEDTLPEMTKEQYDWWFRESLVLDGVRMGPPLTTQNTTDNEPGEALVACRFCGKEPKDFWDGPYLHISGPPDGLHFYSVVCNGCCSTASYESKERAVKKWNSRAPLAAVAVERADINRILNEFEDAQGGSYHINKKLSLAAFLYEHLAAAASSAPAEPSLVTCRCGHVRDLHYKQFGPCSGRGCSGCAKFVEAPARTTTARG